jgi:hypothetical protein
MNSTAIGEAHSRDHQARTSGFQGITPEPSQIPFGQPTTTFRGLPRPRFFGGGRAGPPHAHPRIGSAGARTALRCRTPGARRRARVLALFLRCRIDNGFSGRGMFASAHFWRMNGSGEAYSGAIPPKAVPLPWIAELLRSSLPRSCRFFVRLRRMTARAHACKVDPLAAAALGQGHDVVDLSGWLLPAVAADRLLTQHESTHGRTAPVAPVALPPSCG